MPANDSRKEPEKSPSKWQVWWVLDASGCVYVTKEDKS